MLKKRLNASVHFISGMAIAFFTLAVAFLAPEGYFSAKQLLLWVTIGLIIVALEYITAVKHWHGPASGVYLSIALHLVFAVTVIATIAYEFRQNRPFSPVSWFHAKQFGAVTILAITRISAATFLLISKC